MTSFPSRLTKTYISSLIDGMKEIPGVFCIEVIQTLMIPQLLEFLHQEYYSVDSYKNSSFKNFIFGMAYWQQTARNSLFYSKHFASAEQLRSFDLEELTREIQALELLADVNLSYNKIVYYHCGTGMPSEPLMIVERLPFGRGLAFEVEERGLLRDCLINSDSNLPAEIEVAQTHYSTGLALLAGEDQIAGLIDAAFMQFYLSVECVMGSHRKKDIEARGRAVFGDLFNNSISKAVQHIYELDIAILGMGIHKAK